MISSCLSWWQLVVHRLGQNCHFSWQQSSVWGYFLLESASYSWLPNVSPNLGDRYPKMAIYVTEKKKAMHGLFWDKWHVCKVCMRHRVLKPTCMDMCEVACDLEATWAHVWCCTKREFCQMEFMHETCTCNNACMLSLRGLYYMWD